MSNQLFYFVPGQVILHLEHPEGLTTNEINDQVMNFLKSPDEVLWNPLDILPEQTITFPIIRSDEGKEISLVITQFNIDSIEEYRKEVYKHQDELIDLLVSLYDDLREGRNIPDDNSDIFLRFISPNWLAGGASHLPGTGGPGAWPVQAGEPTGNEWIFNFPGDAIPKDAGKGIEVAILDTAHPRDVLSKAYSQWPRHPLVKRLLGNEGMLMADDGSPNVVHYGFSQEETWEHFSLVEHRYAMPDHGLFVAGIIHTIAPRARLKLYEVLNQYGVGSYPSIYTGLARVLHDLELSREEGRYQKLIINLSLVLRMPFTEDEGFRHCDPGLTDRYADPDKIHYFIKMRASIQEIFNQLVKLDDVLVVAAAGNDARCTDDRPPARYPASFPGVIGVGAMPKDSQSTGQGHHRVASYSNLCDEPPSATRPPYSGYVTFGGEAGVNQGIRGIYISDNFPDYNSPPIDNNKTGWAWWAGTSFATPIISGLLAVGWSKNWKRAQWMTPSEVLMETRGLLSRPGSARRAHDFIIWASGAGQVQPHRTGANERVIDVRQP